MLYIQSQKYLAIFQVFNNNCSVINYSMFSMGSATQFEWFSECKESPARNDNHWKDKTGHQSWYWVCEQQDRLVFLCYPLPYWTLFIKSLKQISNSLFFFHWLFVTGLLAIVDMKNFVVKIGWKSFSHFSKHCLQKCMKMVQIFAKSWQMFFFLKVF